MRIYLYYIWKHTCIKISGNPKLTNISKVQVISDRIPALYLPNLSPKNNDSIDLDESG
jgi:hypothetical protein